MHKRILVGIVSVAMILLMSSTVLSAGVHHSGLPKTNEILYKAYPGAGPDAIVDEFLTKVTDMIGGPGRLDLYNRVVDAGHKVTPMDPMAEFAFAAINCRATDLTSGAINFPLNDSSFRLAFSYIYGTDRKATDIFSYVQALWTFSIGNPVPPAQEPFYEETIQMPLTDWDAAEAILTAAGYSVNPGDNWLYRGGVKLRNMVLWYSTGALYWERGPGTGFVRAFNEFITTHLGAAGPTMSAVPVSFSTLVSQLLLYHDYDLICIGLTNLGRYVDWLYDLLHSDNIAPWAWNFCEIIDADFDAWTETILTSLDLAEIIDAAALVQDKFVNELMPWFPISSGKAFATAARDDRGEVMNVISMPNYGPMNDWTWVARHWKGAWPGGIIKQAMGDTVHTMNPWTEDTLYGWQMLARAYDGLYAVHPVTLKDSPWIATAWTITNWTSIPELGITDGSLCTYYLRQDVTWHDGKPLTAADCVNNMRLMRKYKPGRYSTTWAYLVYEEADGPYKFTAYFPVVSQYFAANVAGTALLSPKHVSDAVEAKYGHVMVGWDPAWNSYKSLMGVDPPAKYSFMKQIVGCNAYVYDYFDVSLQRGRVVKYDEYFVSAPVIGAIVGEWRIDNGTTYTYKGLIQNAAAKEDSENGEVTSVTVDVKIYEDGILKHTETGQTLAPFDHLYLGDYTIPNVGPGKHLIKIEVYDGATLIHTYTHEFHAVPKEDVSTYSGDIRDDFIDIKDVLRAAIAYGAYPGSLRWDPPADVNDDYFVDIKDILPIATKYGWTP